MVSQWRGRGLLFTQFYNSPFKLLPIAPGTVLRCKSNAEPICSALLLPLRMGLRARERSSLYSQMQSSARLITCPHSWDTAVHLSSYFCSTFCSTQLNFIYKSISIVAWEISGRKIDCSYLFCFSVRPERRKTNWSPRMWSTLFILKEPYCLQDGSE